MGYFKWTNEAKEKFIQMYPTCSIEETMKVFSISKHSIMAKACELKIKRKNVQNSNYTIDEDTILLNGIKNNKTIIEIHQDIPWRTIKSIQSRLGKISNNKRKFWSDNEDILLKNTYERLPLDETVRLFPDRTRTAIILRAEKLGLCAYVDTKYYSQEEEDFIKNNYRNMSDEEMGSILGRSKSSIKNHRALMGIYRMQKENTNYENVNIYVRRHNQQWKKDSMVNCGFSCIVTNDRFDEIHHLVSLNIILQNVYSYLNINKDTFDINSLSNKEKDYFMECVYKEQSKYPLGICLKKNIHCQFHNQYGYGDNTIEQFEEFLHTNYPNIKLNLN